MQGVQEEKIKRVLQVRRCRVKNTWGNGGVQEWGMHRWGVQDEARGMMML